MFLYMIDLCDVSVNVSAVSGCSSVVRAFCRWRVYFSRTCTCECAAAMTTKLSSQARNSDWLIKPTVFRPTVHFAELLVICPLPSKALYVRIYLHDSVYCLY